jgi:hypothetical protein
MRDDGEGEDPANLTFRDSFQRDSEDDAAVASRISTGCSCAIDVATLIHVEVGRRVGPVGTLECVQHGIMSPRGKPKNDATASRCTACGISCIATEVRCPVKIVAIVANNTCKGRRPSAPPAKL